MSVSKRALIVVDIQQDCFGGALPIVYPKKETSLANIVKLIKFADSVNMPVAIIWHENPSTALAFAKNSYGFELHNDIKAIMKNNYKRVYKHYASIFDDTDLELWLKQKQVNTITLVGYMTNNCILASASSGSFKGFKIEVLSDATGSINLKNKIGCVSAKDIQENIMTLLHSNFAAVGTCDEWVEAVSKDYILDKSNLLASSK